MRCTYPDCDCVVSFPTGYRPSTATECPRSDSVPDGGGKSWFGRLLEALFSGKSNPYGIGAGGDPGPHTIEEARLIARNAEADKRVGLWYWSAP